MSLVWLGDPEPVVTVAPVPSYRLLIRGVLLPQAVIIHYQPGPLDAIGVAEIQVPLLSPGVEVLAKSGGHEFDLGISAEIWRDEDLVYDGFVDAVDVDWITGWSSVSLLEHTGHADRTVVGDAERNSIVPNGNFETDTAGWEAVNATIAHTGGLRGTGAMEISTNDASTDGHYAFTTIDLDASDSTRAYYSGIRIKLVDVHGVDLRDYLGFQIALHYPATDDLAAAVDDAGWVGVPSGTLSGQSVFFEGPSFAVTAGRPCTVHAAVWTPRHGAVICDSVMIVRNDNLGVAPGGTASQLVRRLWSNTFAKVGAAVAAIAKVVRGGGATFPAGEKYSNADHSGNAADIADWTGVTTEWRYRPSLRRVDVGPKYSLGYLRPDVRVYPLKSHASSAGMAQRAYAISAEGGIAREEASFTVDTDDDHPIWETVVTAKPGADPDTLDTLARTTATEAAKVLPDHDVVVGIPPGGRCPGDWLARGLAAGDRVVQDIAGGPFDFSLDDRITLIDVYPNQGDALAVTLGRSS